MYESILRPLTCFYLYTEASEGYLYAEAGDGYVFSARGGVPWQQHFTVLGRRYMVCRHTTRHTTQQGTPCVVCLVVWLQQR